MKRFVLHLVTLVLASGLVQAQDDAVHEYAKLFQQGIDDLTEGRYDDGIQAFKRCLELVPEDNVCAYNIACGYSLKNEADPAVEWFGKSVDWGFGWREGNIEHVANDTDLDNVREDPRFIAHYDRMKAMVADAEAYAKEPAVHIPEGLVEGEEWPLLVVLHDFGKTKESVVEGPWRDVADALGFALVAPSGKFPATSQGPEGGMSWFMNVNDYVLKPWNYERTASDAVIAFRKEHKMDRGRVLIAGDGVGGMVAFNMAVRAPGLYKGVLVHNGIFYNELAQSKAVNAGKRGLKAGFLFESQGPIFRFLPLAPENYDDDVVANAIEASMKTWGIEHTIHTYELDEEAETAFPLEKIVDTLQGFLPQPVGADG